MPGAGVGTPFADWGELAGEAGRLFPTPFELPAGGVGSAGLGAGTSCAGGCGSPEKKSLGTAVPAVSTTGSFLVTSTVFVSSIAFGNAAALGFPDVNGKPESPSGLDSLDSPSELESSGWLTFKGDFPGLSLTTPSLLSSGETPPATPVPASRTPSNASGAPSVLTGHGGGGVMKVGSGLGSPGKIVVV